METHHLPGAAADHVDGPLVHEPPAPLEQVASEVGPFHATDRVSQRRFGNLSRLAQSRAHQSRNDERNPCTVARSARPVSLNTLVNVMSDRDRPRFIGDGNNKPEPSSSIPRLFRAQQGSPLPAEPGDLRRSSYASLRSRHSRASMSISAQAASLASPLRAAVQHRKPKAEFRGRAGAGCFHRLKPRRDLRVVHRPEVCPDDAA